MKFKCWQPKDKTKWHKYFAWHPVMVAPGECRWLEVVYRRGTFHDMDVGFDYYVPASWSWEYAMPDNEERINDDV